jgi:hypothetical protein
MLKDLIVDASSTNSELLMWGTMKNTCRYQLEDYSQKITILFPNPSPQRGWLGGISDFLMNDVDPRVGSLMKCYRILSFLDRHLRN